MNCTLGKVTCHKTENVLRMVVLEPKQHRGGHFVEMYSVHNEKKKCWVSSMPSQRQSGESTMFLAFVFVSVSYDC